MFLKSNSIAEVQSSNDMIKVVTNYKDLVYVSKAYKLHVIYIKVVDPINDV